MTQNGNVIAYASRNLKAHEGNYPVHDLELAAICRWMDLIKDYDFEIKYHPGSANPATYVLSRKVYISALRTSVVSSTVHEWCSWASIFATREISKGFEAVVLEDSSLREDILSQAHRSRFIVHPGSAKMYKDLRMRQCDAICVVVDRLSKSAYFLPYKHEFNFDRMARLYIQEIVHFHGVPLSIVSDRDLKFTSRFWESFQRALGSLPKQFFPVIPALIEIIGSPCVSGTCHLSCCQHEGQHIQEETHSSRGRNASTQGELLLELVCADFVQKSKRGRLKGILIQ
ncbi:uncharacterized protein [Henckelia pumila]|uniref:uncharacterized protein n=1 Tax=Henckelia pumila TaxID=405737 RepID=UPI003C6E2311